MVQKKQKENPEVSPQLIPGLLVWVTRLFSLPVTVLLHSGYGSRFLGVAGPVAIVPMLVVAASFPDADPRPLLALTVIYVVRILYCRMVFLYRLLRRRPEMQHTRYGGTPWVMRWLPAWRLQPVLWLEALGVFTFGYCLHWLTAPLGCYLMLGACGQIVWLGLSFLYNHNRVQDLHDAAIEQQTMTEKYRGMNGQ
jgi:hypothetical protein